MIYKTCPKCGHINEYMTESQTYCCHKCHQQWGEHVTGKILGGS